MMQSRLSNFMVYILIFVFIMSITSVNSHVDPKPSHSLLLSNSNPIVISSSNQFETFNFRGDGSFNNPYVIENLEFKSSNGILIHISNVTSHFLIQNNVIDGITGDFPGIYIENSEHARIENNTILNTSVGLLLESTNHTSIKFNNINTATNAGLVIFQSKNNTITGNNIVNNNLGIYLNGTHNTIKNNFIAHNIESGLEVASDGSNNHIVWNNFVNNSAGLQSQAIDDGFNNTFFGNYWDDYNSKTQTGYPILGNSHNVDLAPVGEENEVLSPPKNVDVDSNFNETAISILALLILIVLIIFLFIQRLKLIQLTEKTLIKILGVVPPVLIGIIDSTKKDIDEFRRIAPIELLEFKFLLNPVRLSIMTILNDQWHFPSYQLREVLELTWGNYNSSLNSLSEKKFIEIREEFLPDDNHTLRKVVYITDHGSKRFKELESVLKRLFG